MPTGVYTFLSGQNNDHWNVLKFNIFVINQMKMYQKNKRKSSPATGRGGPRGSG